MGAIPLPLILPSGPAPASGSWGGSHQTGLAGHMTTMRP